MNSGCKCGDYADIELSWSAIDERIQQTKTLRKSLELLANSRDKLNNLYQCATCNQLWQESRAWSWENKLYCFKVPSIATADWLDEPYMRPHEMVVFNASLDRVLKGVMEKTDPCNVSGCPKKAITGSATCVVHHIQSLQKVSLVPKDPTGRWFPQYSKQDLPFS